jgi:hypothetical protein
MALNRFSYRKREKSPISECKVLTNLPRAYYAYVKAKGKEVMPMKHSQRFFVIARHFSPVIARVNRSPERSEGEVTKQSQRRFQRGNEITLVPGRKGVARKEAGLKQGLRQNFELKS